MTKDVEIEQKQRTHSAKGLQTILPERNRDSWERMQKTWERMWQSSHSLPQSPVSLREISFNQLQSLTINRAMNYGINNEESP
ncbi:MAG: hypothetical protein EGR98_05320 [Prevotella sp.]|nr:hypothetical protein [Prevotella sp.]